MWGNGSVFAQVREAVDGFWNTLLEEKPQLTNPNLRAFVRIQTYWSVDPDGKIPASGLQVTVSVIPGSAVQVDTTSVQYSGGRFVAQVTKGSVTTDGKTPPVYSATVATDANGHADFIIPVLDVSQAYVVGLVDAWPGGLPGTTGGSVPLVPSPQTDWSGATGTGPVYGFVVDAVLPESYFRNNQPGTGPGGSGPGHHQRGT